MLDITPFVLTLKIDIIHYTHIHIDLHTYVSLSSFFCHKYLCLIASNSVYYLGDCDPYAAYVAHLSIVYFLGYVAFVVYVLIDLL